MKVTITNLADDIKYLEEASEWIWEEWLKDAGFSLEDACYMSRHSICKDRIPQMYIAKLVDELIGVAAIWTNDLKARQDLSPWLANLYVKREYRNKGVGTMLQNRCIQATREFRFERLYLITDHEGYYEKTGWKFMETAPYRLGHYTRIYELML